MLRSYALTRPLFEPLSVGSWARVIPMLCMWFALLCNILASSFWNLRVLKAQLLALRSFNIDVTVATA